MQQTFFLRKASTEIVSHVLFSIQKRNSLAKCAVPTVVVTRVKRLCYGSEGQFEPFESSGSLMFTRAARKGSSNANDNVSVLQVGKTVLLLWRLPKGPVISAYGYYLHSYSFPYPLYQHPRYHWLWAPLPRGSGKHQMLQLILTDNEIETKRACLKNLNLHCQLDWFKHGIFKNLFLANRGEFVIRTLCGSSG